MEEKTPLVTEEMMRKTAALLTKSRKKRSAPNRRKIKGMTCPICRADTFDEAEDLVFDCYVLGERTIIPNLSGFKCATCREEAYDAKSSSIIDKYMREKVAGGYECTISTLSAGKLGLYFPKDVLRTMDIKAKIKAIIKPITKKKMIVELGS